MTIQRQNRYKPKLNGIALVNPLPDMVEDTAKLRSIYKDYKLIPYLGTSQFSFSAYVDLLQKLHKYSPTQGSITKSIASACFGGAVIAVDSFDGFGERGGVKESSKANELYDFMRKFDITGKLISKLAIEIYKKAKPTGNAYVLVEYIEVGDTKKVNFKVYDQSWVTKIDGCNSFLVTSCLENLFDPAVDVNIYDEFVSFDELEADETGVKRAMFHFKHTGYENNYYALPDTFSALYPLFNEWQQWDGLLKETDNLFVGRLLLFFEDAISGTTNSPEEDKEKAAMMLNLLSNKLNAATTAGGDSASAISTSLYGHGTKPPIGFTLPSNTNEKWHKEISEQNSAAIYSSNCWSPILTGGQQAETSLGGNLLMDTMEFFNRSTVEPEQRHLTGFLMDIINSMADFDNTVLNGIDISFVTPFQQKIKDADATT